MKLNNLIICGALISAAAIALWCWTMKPPWESRRVAARTWQGYVRNFIAPDGRVMRPDTGDTVSEGQAYAMLRAVWMNDKPVFDRCYAWTEAHLSRSSRTGDHLLAWHWQNNTVQDWMPAADADCDYALSLLFAAERWGSTAPQGTMAYRQKADAVMSDILKHLTFRTASGRLYLAPWQFGIEARAPYPLNPSYYSPAHFEIFYREQGRKEWQELITTTYVLLQSLGESFEAQRGIGLVPDWVQVDDQDRFSRVEGKSADFGWEAVRIPLRVGLDARWFNRPEAHRVLQDFADFCARELTGRGKIYSEYQYNGVAKDRFESPLFYAAYYTALETVDRKLANKSLQKGRKFITREKSGWIYQHAREYYANSLAWWPEGLRSNVIRNLREGDIPHDQ